MNYSKIKKQLKKADNILILMHSDPDIDAIGAAYALLLHFLKKGRNVKIGVEELISSRYSFFINQEDLKRFFILKEKLEAKNFDVLICLDTSDPRLLGSFRSFLKLIEESYVIDHHNTFYEYGKYNLNDSSKSSTSEMIYDFLDGKIGDFLSAQSLYAGIVFDTGNFRYSTSSALFSKLSNLLKEFSIDGEKIYFNIFENESLERKRLQSLIVDTIETFLDGEIVLSFYLQSFSMKLALQKSDTEGMVRVGHSLKGCIFSIYVKEKDSDISISFRCRNDFDVSILANKWGGGGHKKASGLKLKGYKLEDVKKEIIPYCIEEYQKWREINEK